MRHEVKIVKFNRKDFLNAKNHIIEIDEWIAVEENDLLHHTSVKSIPDVHVTGTLEFDGMNFVSKKTLHYINENAFNATLLAHVDGQVPNVILELRDRSAYTFGWLVYFFELACAISGYTLGVNPFDQPGVESYKKNMYALLGKPGYEEERKALLERLG